MGDLQRLIEERLRIRTTTLVNRERSTLGTTAARLMRNDPDRVAAILINLSTTQMFVGPITNPSSTRGIQLGSGGGALTLLWDEDFDLVGIDWYGVANAVDSAIFIVELVSVGAPMTGPA